MATIFNSQDCSTGVLGTASPACETDLGIMTGFILVPKTWSIDTGAVDLTGTYIKDQILAGDFHPFANALDFIQNNEETQFKTYNRGTQLPIRKGLPLFDFIYSNGYSFHASAVSFDSYQRYNILFIHQGGVIQGAVGNDGITLTGLNLGFIDTATYKNADGAEPSETMIKMQLVDNNQYNSKKAIISFADNTINDSDLQGVVQAKVVLGAIAVGATTATAAVTAAFNSGINVLGLLPANFVGAGVNVTAAVFNTGTNVYDLTIDAAVAGNATVSLGDALGNTAADAGGILYKGTSNSVVIA